jgi:hypothetical protein
MFEQFRVDRAERLIEGSTCYGKSFVETLLGAGFYQAAEFKRASCKTTIKEILSTLQEAEKDHAGVILMKHPL